MDGPLLCNLRILMVLTVQLLDTHGPGTKLTVQLLDTHGPGTEHTVQLLDTHGPEIEHTLQAFTNSLLSPNFRVGESAGHDRRGKGFVGLRSLALLPTWIRRGPAGELPVRQRAKG